MELDAALRRRFAFIEPFPNAAEHLECRALEDWMKDNFPEEEERSPGAPQVLFAARRKWLEHLRHLPPPGHTLFMRVPLGLEGRDGWEADAKRLWDSSIRAEVREQIAGRGSHALHTDDFLWEKLVEQPQQLMAEWREHRGAADDGERSSKRQKR